MRNISYISHFPTLTELYTTKSRILKKIRHTFRSSFLGKTISTTEVSRAIERNAFVLKTDNDWTAVILFPNDPNNDWK